MMLVFSSLFSVLALVALNGFFVAAEFALVTVRKTRIDQLTSEGVSSARYVKKAIQDLDRYIAGTQVGITIVSLALGWIGEGAVSKLLMPVFTWLALDITETLQQGISVALAFTAITFLQVILGELVPKSIALNHPESTSLLIARPMRAMIFFLKPLIWSLNGLGHMVLKLIGLQASNENGSVHSPTELLLLIRQSHAAGHLDSFERSMLQKAFRFSETSVEEVMTPRSQVQGLDMSLPIEEILDIAAGASYSRLPAYRESVDEIIGVIYTHELFQYSRLPEPRPPLETLVRTLIYVPESFRLDALVKKFQKKNTQIAAVIDEYGGTAGIITLEDIVETVFGKVQDGNEDPTAEFALQPDSSILLRGDTRLDDLNEHFGWNLQDNDSTTIAGYMMKTVGKILKPGDKLDTAHGQLEVKEMIKQRVTMITFRKH